MDPAALVKIIEHVQITNYFNTANTAFFGYDYLLTLSDEIRYIHDMPFSAVTVLFLLARYLPFVDIALVIIYQQTPYIPPNVCRPLFEGSGMLQLCGVLLSEAILMVRTWAVWGRNKWIGAFLVVAAIATWIPSLYTVQLFLSGLDFAPTGPGCQVAASRHPKSFLAYILVTAFETFLLALTLFKSVMSYRSANSTLYATLIRDGIMFYLALQVLSICSLVVLVTAPEEMSYMLTLTHRVIHGMLSVRLLLNLRGAVSTNTDTSKNTKLPWKIAPQTDYPTSRAYEMRQWTNNRSLGKTGDTTEREEETEMSVVEQG